jgi:hypothetical protein
MRHALARSGLDRTTMQAPMWDRLYAAVANGGHLEASETKVKPDEMRALREALPPLSVFGAALYTYMLPGHMSVGICWPRCRETHEAGLVTELVDVRADDLVEDLGHCRHVDREEQSPEVSGVTPMPTEMEVMATGTVLESEVLFAKHATDIERGAIAFGLHLLNAIGAKTAAGLGRVDVTALEGDTDHEPYIDWLEEGVSTGSLAAAWRELAENLGARRGKAKK